MLQCFRLQYEVQRYNLFPATIRRQPRSRRDLSYPVIVCRCVGSLPQDPLRSVTSVAGSCQVNLDNLTPYMSTGAMRGNLRYLLRTLVSTDRCVSTEAHRVGLTVDDSCLRAYNYWNRLRHYDRNTRLLWVACVRLQHLYPLLLGFQHSLLYEDTFRDNSSSLRGWPEV